MLAHAARTPWPVVLRYLDDDGLVLNGRVGTGGDAVVYKAGVLHHAVF